MSDGGSEGAEPDAKDTDELLYTDLSVEINVSGQRSPQLKPDHCDLLLDAMDAQLGQLQIQPQKHRAISRERDCSNAAPLRCSRSLSKDTGLGSTTQTNDTPMSCLDLIQTPKKEETSEKSTGCRGCPVTHGGTKQQSDTRTRDSEERESQREQVMWRLQRLLGDIRDEESMAGESHPPSESVCTEDFVKCFRGEMVELALPENDTQQLDKEEEAERTGISDFEPKRRNIPNLDAGGGTAETGRSSRETQTAHYSQSNKAHPRLQVEGCISDTYGLNTSCVSEKAGAGGRCKTPIGDDSCTCLPIEDHEAQRQNSCHSAKTRCLAGVPVWSFDTVSIDSDLDSVRTEQVRQHLHRRPGWHSLIQSVTGLDDCCSIHSGYDTPTQEGSESQSPSDTDGEMNDWGGGFRPERTSDRMLSEGGKMIELLTALQHKEETLEFKKTQVKDVECSLSDLLPTSKHALRELEHESIETAKVEKEKRTLDFILRESRAETESISSQRHELHGQKESRILESSVVMSVLEREELDRQLDSAKTELFAAQRRAREKLESVEEKLEETCEELQRVREAESSLRTKCACLEAQQRQAKEQTESKLGECKIRVGTLEKMLAQKELQLLDLKQQRRASQAERDGLKGELELLKSQHYDELKEVQGQARRLMVHAQEAALKQQKKDLAVAHKQKIQKVNMQTEEDKANALKEQAASIKHHIESMKSSIQLKEEEANKMRHSLDQQKEAAKICEEKLNVEHLKKVHEALEEERKKCEVEKVEAVRVHCGILEKQNKKSLESMKSEMQRERNKALALQHTVAKLKTRVEELESEKCSSQREQESLLAVICKSLKEEHQAQLQKLQRQMAQESQRAVLRLERAIQLQGREADGLRTMLEERESSHNRITAELEQQLRHCAQELGEECQQLKMLAQHSGDKHSSVQIPASPTAAEALTTLRELLKHLVSHLQQELNTHRQTTEQLRKDTERELSLQRQQMRMDRDQALDSLKERLIQEHIEELSSLNRVLVCDGGAEGGGAAASLRKQLKAKDLELRQVQRSMSRWKERTAARLACKFEEELTAELERCKTTLLRGRKTSKSQAEKPQKPERPEGETIPSGMDAQSSVRSPSDLASLKLLRYLQSRVKQLRLENQASTWSPSPSNTIPLDLLGSYRTEITPGQDMAEVQSHSSVRTVSS